MIRFLICVAVALRCVAPLMAQEEPIRQDIKLRKHPRLLMFKEDERTVKKNVAKDAVWTEISQALIGEADAIINLPLNERVMQGRRLLSTSRENLRRIFISSYAYRTTKKDKYLKRAESEMLKAASFSDWNPSHFLDVAEMTLAMAIGYDWLYDGLSADTRRTVEDAILEKGLVPSFDKKCEYATNLENNWNQVCNSGLTYGALAVWERNPELCAKILNRAVDKIKKPMKHYAPDGAYPEGIGYWDYGTVYNVLFLDAMEKTFGTDFGLCQMPGFMRSGEYVLNVVTPSLNNFSYSDNPTRAAMAPAIFWFYDKTKDPSLIYNQISLYKKYGPKTITKERISPAIVVWGASASLEHPEKPQNMFWKGGGDNPICVMRTSWDEGDNAKFLGFKLGKPTVSHGHIDVGSFFYESDGVVWAMDLGSENYGKLEACGIDLWNGQLGSQRWDVYRYNNLAHNTLSFNRRYQNLWGYAALDSSSDAENDMFAMSDLTPLYKDYVKSVKRAVSLVDKDYVVIEDLVEADKRFAMMSWTMVTPAATTLLSDSVVMLEKNGKKMYLKVEAPQPIRWKIAPAVSEFTYDSPNPGVTLIRFDMDMPLNSEQKLNVFLLPDLEKGKNFNPVLK